MKPSKLGSRLTKKRFEAKDLLAALRDPKHEQHDEMVEWVGGDFDPTVFDLAAANKALGRRKR